MNSKTAKQLARAAAALTLVTVTQAEMEKPRGQRLSPRKRVEAIQWATRRTYTRLKAKWYATPRPKRHAFRKRMRGFTQRTKGALAQA